MRLSVFGYGAVLAMGLCGWLTASAQSVPPQVEGRQRDPPTASSANLSGTSAASTIDISGRVLDARNRQPIARALVRFANRSVLTDRDGIFTFPGVASTPASSQGFTPSRSSSTYAFTVTKPGFYDAEGNAGTSQAFRFSAGSPIELLLYPEAILSGTATDASGESLSHLSVVARRSVFEEGGHYWYPAGQTQTGSDGGFRLTVPAGAYSLLVSSLGRTAAGSEVILPLLVPATTSSINEAVRLSPGQETHYDLRLETRRAYQVTFNFDGGGGAGFPFLTARTATGTSMPLRPVPTRGDNRGELRVAMPSGTYTVLGTMQNQEGLSEAQAQVTVTDHDVAGLALHFVHAPSLPVVVEADSSITSDNAKPPDAMQLGLSLQPTVESPEAREQTYRLVTRRNATPSFAVPEGVYHLRAQAVGQWFITSATCGGVDLLTQDLPVSAGLNGTEIRIRLSNKTGNLSGTVMMNGVPSAAWVYLLPSVPSATPVMILRAGVDGGFFRPYLAAGSYRVVALERKINADLQSTATLNLFLDRLQTFSVAAGEQRTLNLAAVPERELPQ